MHAVSQASFPLTLPSLVRPGGSRRAARGEGEKKHVFNKIPPVPFFRAGARKDKPRAFLGRGLPCGTLPPGRERDWDPRDASVGPLAAGGRGGAGPFRGPEARPTREAEAAISRSAPGLGSGPSNLARGRQRVRSLFGCPSRPPWGAVVLAGALGASSSGRIPAACRTTRSNPCTGGSGLFSHD